MIKSELCFKFLNKVNEYFCSIFYSVRLILFVYPNKKAINLSTLSIRILNFLKLILFKSFNLQGRSLSMNLFVLHSVTHFVTQSRV